LRRNIDCGTFGKAAKEHPFLGSIRWVLRVPSLGQCGQSVNVSGIAA
jgi:hypothetical protein